jgi:exodeoxyribonuclease-3
MRIVTWNCQMGLSKKTEALLSLNPDVAVVPECSEKSAAALRERGYETLWIGSNSLKGLGVFCREGWSIRALLRPKQKWIVPVEVDGPTPFTLIAVWACRIGIKKADNYIGQVYRALISHPEWFNENPLVVAGDLNSNKIWDRERLVGNHSDVVKILAEHGLVSGYHEYFDEAQGAESRPTIYLYRHAHRTFHIDYIFIPQEWATHLKTVDVGSYEQWSKLSDHCPVTVEI